jgi:hypothetical protein
LIFLFLKSTKQSRSNWEIVKKNEAEMKCDGGYRKNNEPLPNPMTTSKNARKMLLDGLTGAL